MNRRWKKVAMDEGPVVLLVILLFGVIGAYRSALSERDVRLNDNRDSLLRVEAADRLTGARLPSVATLNQDGDTVEVGEAVAGGGVWVLSPNECVGCLDDIQEWNAAPEMHQVKVQILFSDISPDEASELADAVGLRIPYLVDERGTLRKALGVVLSSTYLAVADDRALVMVDSGSDQMRCRRGFPQRLAYLTLSPAPSTP